MRKSQLIRLYAFFETHFFRVKDNKFSEGELASHPSLLWSYLDAQVNIKKINLMHQTKFNLFYGEDF